MKGSFRLGTAFGIGVFVHWTFAILILFIVFTSYRAGQDAEQILWSVLFILSIFVTVFLHELGHALAAKRYNIGTRDITLLPIGGLARLEKIPEEPKEELVVALAGPAVNIMIAIIVGLFISFPSNADDAAAIMGEGINPSNFMLYFFMVNIWLSIFNMIPAFPMDGGRVLRALLSMGMGRIKATNIAARIGQLVAIGFVFAGFYVNPFLIFIGLFIILGAQGELTMTQTTHFLRGYTISDILMKQYETLDIHATLGDAVDKILNGPYKSFIVTEDGVCKATLSRDEIIKALAEKGKQVSIREVMNTNMLSFELRTPIDEVYARMNEAGQEIAVITERGQFTGVVDTENIMEFIMIRNAVNRSSSSSMA